MKDWMHRLKGVNSAAMTRVEATMASCGSFSCLVDVCKAAWVAVTPPEVRQCQKGSERAVDEGAVYEEINVVEAVLEDGDPYGHVHDDEGHVVERYPHHIRE